jgi:hypothetical protein
MLIPLEQEFKYYREHQDELVAKYNGKAVAIKDCKVLGAYNDELEAVTETMKEHALGTFFVMKCLPGLDHYTVIVHSPSVLV